MIDREGRDRFALALRRYASGRIDSDALDEAGLDADWRDRGLNAVCQMAWNLYPDHAPIRAVGKERIPREGRRQIARWVIFLRSADEYLWPEYRFDGIYWWPLDLLTFGAYGRRVKRLDAQFFEAGEFAAWPFIGRQALALALKRSRFGRGAC